MHTLILVLAIAYTLALILMPFMRSVGKQALTNYTELKCKQLVYKARIAANKATINEALHNAQLATLAYGRDVRELNKPAILRKRSGGHRIAFAQDGNKSMQAAWIAYSAESKKGRSPL